MYLDPAPATPATAFARRAVTSALVVDDADFDRKRLIRASEKAGLGLTFREARSLSEMQARLAEGAFDLIFIDFRLPDGDGLDALSAVSADLANRTAATLMIAGQSDLTVAVAALQRGCDDYLDKSGITPDSLRDAVTAALGRAAAQRAEAQAADRADKAARRLARMGLAARGTLRRDLDRLTAAAGGNHAAAALRLRDFLDEVADAWSPPLH